MKPSLAFAALVLAVGALACAQETTGGRVVVPARNTSHPRVVKATVYAGSIAVKTYSGNDVIVETDRPEEAHAHADSAPAGMKRIDLPRGLDVEEEDNVVTVRAHPGGPAHLVITVPTDTSLNLKSFTGNIVVDGVHGEIDASSHSGHITLTNVSGTVVANAFSGALKIAMDRVDPAKPMSFSTFNGPIDVTFPASLKANIKLKTSHGEIFSDFDVKLTGGHPITEKNNTSDGKFRLRNDGTVYGEINGGGAEASFQTFNGRITLRKK
jgi:DUF4097 and DUF4098 domain-containing protein YvlB